MLPTDEIVEVIEHQPIRLDPLPDPISLLDRLSGGGTHIPVASLPLGHDEAQRRFIVPFGSDALWISDLAGSDKLQLVTVLHLAAQQGLPRGAAPRPEEYDARCEEPGRILHEERDPATDPQARALTARKGWGWPYFHTDHTTPLFVERLATLASQRPGLLRQRVTQRDGVERTLAEVLGASVGWILRRQDPASALLFSHRVTFATGTQGRAPSAYGVWQDSRDAAVLEDGSISLDPIAWTEVQGYTHDALKCVARLVDTVPMLSVELAPHLHPFVSNVDQIVPYLLQRAATVERSVLDHGRATDRHGPFFTYGIRMTPDGLAPIKVRKSNPGHLLDSEMFRAPSHQPVVEQLITSLLDRRVGMATPFGVATLDPSHPSFRPGAYHNGQVWLWEQIVMARGAESRGHHEIGKWLRDGVDLAVQQLQQYPEFVRWTKGPTAEVNTHEIKVRTTAPGMGDWLRVAVQQPQAVQGWTVGAEIDNARAHALRQQLPQAPEASPFERRVLAQLPGRTVGRQQHPHGTRPPFAL